MASNHKEWAGLAAISATKANDQLINALLTSESSTLNAFRNRLLEALSELRRAEEWVIRAKALADQIADSNSK